MQEGGGLSPGTIRTHADTVCYLNCSFSFTVFSHRSCWCNDFVAFGYWCTLCKESWDGGSHAPKHIRADRYTINTHARGPFPVAAFPEYASSLSLRTNGGTTHRFNMTNTWFALEFWPGPSLWILSAATDTGCTPQSNLGQTHGVRKPPLSDW